MITLKPAVSQTWLLAAAGLMWSAVGVMLCHIGYQWLVFVSPFWETLDGVLGVIMALAIYYFGFSKIAKKNINRLNLYPDKACFFAFQAWKSYLIIAVMIIFGIMLRHTLIQRYYLAIVYIAIGGAMFLSSFLYYIRIWRRAGDNGGANDEGCI